MGIHMYEWSLLYELVFVSMIYMIIGSRNEEAIPLPKDIKRDIENKPIIVHSAHHAFYFCSIQSSHLIHTPKKLQTHIKPVK